MNNISINNYRTTLNSNETLLLKNLKLPELHVCKNAKNEPETWIGSSSVVFKLYDNNRYFALKCYITELIGRWEYLKQVQQKITKLENDRVVPFEIFENALTVKDDEQKTHTCSVLLMPWIEGERLANRIKVLCKGKNRNLLKVLTQSLIDLAKDQLSQNYSHGDITPENLIITPGGKIILIDYDTFGFTDMKKLSAYPRGWNYSYQHPSRHPLQTDIHADEFSLLVLIISLKALESEPELYSKYNSTKGLLFTIDDFRNPLDSKLVKDLKLINDPYLQRLLKVLLVSLDKNTTHIPELSLLLSGRFKDADEELLDTKIEELKKKPFLSNYRVSAEEGLVLSDSNTQTPENRNPDKEKSTLQAIKIVPEVKRNSSPKKNKIKAKTIVLSIAVFSLLIAFGVVLFLLETDLKSQQPIKTLSLTAGNKFAPSTDIINNPVPDTLNNPEISEIIKVLKDSFNTNTDIVNNTPVSAIKISTAITETNKTTPEKELKEIASTPVTILKRNTPRIKKVIPPQWKNDITTAKNKNTQPSVTFKKTNF
jgi:thiamine kinase-like enzyme